MTAIQQTAEWPTYKGFDGEQHPMPVQTCRYCGEHYPGFYDTRYGHTTCTDETQRYWAADMKGFVKRIEREGKREEAEARKAEENFSFADHM